MVKLKKDNIDAGVTETVKIVTTQKLEGKPIKKRPWRDKIRKQAKKDAAKEKRAIQTPEAVTDGDINADSALKTKKKKKRKKKFVEQASTEVKPVEDVPLGFVEESKKKLEAGRFRFLNEQLYTMSGPDAWKFFQDDPEAFQCYHKGFAEQVKKWPNHPLTVITKWLLEMQGGKVVLDLGCGEAKIAENVGSLHTVHSFDLVAVNDRVVACDMSHLPLGEGEADVAVFCLSLMGTNLYDFVKEARRTLCTGGIMKVAEVTSRFVNVRLFCDAVCKMGFELKEKKPLTDYFMLFEFIKIDKVEQKRPFGLKLKPCLYKKR